jgi:hypothetical protein
MRKVTVTLALGILLLGAAGAVTLTRSPVRVAYQSGSPEHALLGVTIGDTVLCQADELMPAGIAAIRLPMVVFFGMPVSLMVFEGSRVIASGSHDADWTGTSVTVPVRPLSRPIPDTKICVAMSPNSEPVVIPGDRALPTRAAVTLRSTTLTAAAAEASGAPLSGRMALQFLTPGRKSWWARILTVARRMGLGRAFAGTWIALLVAALMLLVAALALRLTLREVP